MFLLTKQYDPSHYEKTHPHNILQVPTTQLAKMSIDPKFVELTADVLEILLLKKKGAHPYSTVSTIGAPCVIDARSTMLIDVAHFLLRTPSIDGRFSC